MRWRDALVLRLLQSPAVTALVGDRISGIQAELPALPAITYARISTRRAPTLQTRYGSLVMPRVQIDCWATTSDQAEALGDAVLAALHGFSGVVGPATLGFILADNDMDAFEGAAGLNRRTLDFVLASQEVA